MLDIAADALLSSLQSAAGRSITYRRGSATVALTALPGMTAFQIAEDAQIIEEVRSRDFIFYASELILSGQRTEPAAGDRISETKAGATTTYEVMTPAQGQRPFRYSDSEQTIIRVFTKRIS